MKKICINPEGKYLGVFDGSDPQEPFIEVGIMPEHGMQAWDGSQWNDTPELTKLKWVQDMQETDSTCPRWFEDYVTENSVALAPGKSKESYDAKVLLRSNKP